MANDLPFPKRELEKLDDINDEAAAGIVRQFEKSAESPRRKRHTPWPIKVPLFVGISALGFLAIRTLPDTASEGWLPAIAVVAALALIVAALIELKRTR